MGSPFLHFALGRSHLPENSILFVNRPFAARFSNYSKSINFNTTRQNDLKWRKTCTGLKFNLEHFNGPQTKFIGNSLYKHPVVLTGVHQLCSVVSGVHNKVFLIQALCVPPSHGQQCPSLLLAKIMICSKNDLI